METRQRSSSFFTTICCLLFLSLFIALPVMAQAPLKVGDEYGITIESGGISDVEAMSTARGQLYRLVHEDASYIALHFDYFHLGADEVLIVSDANGGQSYEMTGRGKMNAGTFWAQHIKGDTVVLELVQSGPRRGRGFLVDRYAGGFADFGGGPDTEAICGTDDKDNAICYQSSHPTEYDRGRAVARLLIQGSSLCTGWLASASNHLITNEHCISSATAALNTDYEFMSEAPNCGDSNCQLCWDGTVFSGANFIQDNANLDYALVQITAGDPAATYGFLSIDNRVAVIGEEIYIPQHPGGRAKEFGIASSHLLDASGLCHVNSFEPACSGTGYQDVGYMCDTEGGSSGSPVLARSSHQVIALHHCANCENRGVPIDLVCAEVCSYFGPQCTVDADCDDGNICTADSCDSGSCTSTPIPGCCGNDMCDGGEDCVSCPNDCISGSGSCGDGVCDPTAGEDCVSCSADCNGKQNGKPSNRFCCGDGDGVNPVGCGDSRCTSGGFSCDLGGGVSFCCGDGFCEGAEDSQSCGVDCPVPYCGDGVCDPDLGECSACADCIGNPACSAVDCSMITSKRPCNNEPLCHWDNRARTCIDA